MSMTTNSLRKLICRVALVAVAAFSVSALSAQSGYEKNNEIFRIGVEGRLDYLNQAVAGNHDVAGSGFKVRYFNFRMDGQISPKFSYSWRQRFNRANSISEFAQNTDWFTLTYKPTSNWAISAGKQVLMIGGWEYDRAPIELYFCSEFWNNVNCYQIGASVAYTTNSGNDTILFQACQSPYDTTSNDVDYYAFNLYWSGSHGCYTALYSLNFMQYAPGKYDTYLALGNQFTFGDAKLQLDFMNRATDDHAFFLKDCSVMGELSYLINNKLNVFGRMTYDVNKTNSVGDLCVLPGTELTRVGAGLEYYPLKDGNRNLRFHLYACQAFGKNGNPAGTMLPEQTFVDLGVKFKVDILSLTNKIF